MLLCINPAFEQEFISPLLANEQLSYVRLSDQIPWQREIREEIMTIYHERNERVAPLLIQAHFCRIWAKLSVNMGAMEYHAAASENLNIIKKMVSYVQENYREKLTLAEIAASGAVGQSKCCKLFKVHTG